MCKTLKFQGLFVSTLLAVGITIALNVTTKSALAQNTTSGNMTNATHAKASLLGTITNKTMNASIVLPKSTTTSPTLPTSPK
jgi:hypothetical protein